MKAHRLARVGEVVREVAATTILMELRDPRVKKVTVTRAEVTADLQHATIFVSVMGSEREQNLTLHGLQSAAGFIQSRLADRMQTRFTPVVQFKLDPGVKNSLEIARLLREEAARQPGGPGGPPEEAEAEGLADG
jgi:ribosome-binding factor A